MKLARQEQPPQQLGLTTEGLRRLRDAADPDKPHSYEWYVIENINSPGVHMDRTPSLEAAIRMYAALDRADKRLGVTKDDIATVDLVIRKDGREWISEDYRKLDSFARDPVVAEAVGQIRQAMEEQTQGQAMTMGEMM